MDDFPTPIGVFTQIKKPTYEEEFHKQIDSVKKARGDGDLRKLLFSGNTWEVKERN
jgi:2-oxoglutarate ferredoxin oxidoreductase subunit beta